MSIAPLYRAVVNLTRTRKSLVATAAVVGALGTASASAVVMSWGHAPDSAASASDASASARTAAVRASGSGRIEASLTALRAAGARGSVITPAARQSPGKPAAKRSPAKRSSARHPAAEHVTAAAEHVTAAGKPKPHKPHKAHRPHRPHKAAKAKSGQRASAKPYLIYDSVVPSAIPAGKTTAVYVNGAYAASSAQVAGRRSVLWIDTNGSNPAAHVLDVEPGDATPAGAGQWVHARLRSRPGTVAIVYTMRSQWGAVKYYVSRLPKWMQSRVRYWIADPTGVPHIVPGSDATQWYWGKSYDITTANPNFQR